MNLKTRFIIFSLLGMGIITLIMIYISIRSFRDEMNSLTTKLYTERIEKLLFEAREHDNMYFEGLYQSQQEAKERVIDQLRVYYRDNLGSQTYPFILTTDGKIVVHPFLPSSNRKVVFPEISKKYPKK